MCYMRVICVLRVIDRRIYIPKVERKVQLLKVESNFGGLGDFVGFESFLLGRRCDMGERWGS